MHLSSTKQPINTTKKFLRKRKNVEEEARNQQNTRKSRNVWMKEQPHTSNLGKIKIPNQKNQPNTNTPNTITRQFLERNNGLSGKETYNMALENFDMINNTTIS